MPYPLCIHHAISHFTGRVNLSVGESMRLQLHGPTGTSDTLEVRVQSPTPTGLPMWLRVYALASLYLCPGVRCTGNTCLVHRVPWIEGTAVCVSSWVNFETWTLQLPWVPPIPLTSLIGFSPVHVVMRHGETELGRLVVQRRQHCVHMTH